MAQLRLTLESHPDLQQDFEGVVEATEIENLGPDSAVKYSFQVTLESQLPPDCPMRRSYEVVIDYLHLSRAFKFRPHWTTRHAWKSSARGDLRPYGLVHDLEVKKLPEPLPNDRCLAFRRDLLRLGPREMALRDPDALTWGVFDKTGPVRFALISDRYFRELRALQHGPLEVEECHVVLLGSPPAWPCPAGFDPDWHGPGYRIVWKSCDSALGIRVTPEFLYVRGAGQDIRCRPLQPHEWLALQSGRATLLLERDRNARGGEHFSLGDHVNVRRPAWGPFLQFVVQHLEMVRIRFVVRRFRPEGDDVVYFSG